MTKKIYETLHRDPRKSPLANNGQARITTLVDENALRELEAELTTFVCDGQYGDAIQRILQSYLTQQGQARQNAAWVSGFFGSGKSHLQKMLGHLWANTALGGGKRARDLVLELPEEVRGQFRELDTLATRSGRPLVAASGAMPSGAKDAVRATVLAILLKAQGFPEKVPQARFCFWLQERGFLDGVRAAVEAEGSSWFEELDELYVSPVIAAAVLEADPDFAADNRQARQVIREQFPNREGDITTAEFVQLAHKALAPEGGELPHTMLVLDEVQQYIGDSNDRATDFVELAEALQTEMDSRVLLVASGQSSLLETPQLQKLKDRFRINVQLSDTDVETVIRKVILQKRADAQAAVQEVLDANAGEVSKQLQESTIKERSEDHQIVVADYPLLPTRRRFWEECFRSVDVAGTSSQLRSQLRIIFDAVKEIAEAELGRVITGDVLFQAMGPDLVNSGVLLNELNNRITALDDGTEAGKLKQSLCGLAFLISRLPREQGADKGIRATARTLADLMVADLRQDSGPLRQHVADLLEAMADDGTLMKVGDQPGLEEYRLQTTEGAQWQRLFDEKRQAVRNDPTEVTTRRENLLGTAVQDELKGIRLLQGDSKTQRGLTLWMQGEQPPPSKEQVVVWVRDGWGCSDKDVRDAAREAGADNPVLHVFLPRRNAEDLRNRIIDATAARRVLDHYGTPSSPEGVEARQAMQSRLLRAEEDCNELIADVIANAVVLKGGGIEEYGPTLKDKVQSAASEASLARLFPEFSKADHASWGLAVRRAREGSDSPLEAVGHKGPNDSHPVARQVLACIGGGKEGSAIRNELKVAPYGWPQDAMDAVLLALHRDGTLSAKDSGNHLITPGQLDQQSLAKARFHLQEVRLTALEKVGVRGVFSIAGVSARSGEEEAKASDFLDVLDNKLALAGGDPPLPTSPAPLLLKELRGMAGPELLKAILEHKDQLKAQWDEACTLVERKDKRWPQWERLMALLEQAHGLPVCEEVEPQVQALREQRILLDPANDFVTPLVQQLEQALSAALEEAQQQLNQVLTSELQQLQDSAEWQGLPEAEQTRISQSLALPTEPPAAEPLERSQLLNALKQRSLASRAELAESLPTRFAKARTAAAKALEPSTQALKLSSGVLKDEAALEAWWATERQKLVAALTNGPIQIN